MHVYVFDTYSTNVAEVQNVPVIPASTQGPTNVSKVNIVNSMWYTAVTTCTCTTIIKMT